MRSKIAGIGYYVPRNVYTNKDLMQFMETSDEWIRTRSGIERRHFAAEGQTTSDLAIRAARLGFRVKEVPVTRAYPEGAPAPTKISPIKGNLLVLQTMFRACLGKYNPAHAPSER